MGVNRGQWKVIFSKQASGEFYYGYRFRDAGDEVRGVVRDVLGLKRDQAPESVTITFNNRNDKGKVKCGVSLDVGAAKKLAGLAKDAAMTEQAFLQQKIREGIRLPRYGQQNIRVNPMQEPA